MNSQPTGIPQSFDLNDADTLISRADANDSAPSVQRVGHGLQIVTIPTLGGAFLSASLIDENHGISSGLSPRDSPLSKTAVQQELVALNEIGAALNVQRLKREAWAVDELAARYAVRGANLLAKGGLSAPQHAAVIDGMYAASTNASEPIRANIQKLVKFLSDGSQNKGVPTVVNKLSATPLIDQIRQALNVAADQIGNDPGAMKDLLMNVIANLDDAADPRSASSGASSSGQSSGDSSSPSQFTNTAPVTGGSAVSSPTRTPTPGSGPTTSMEPSVKALSDRVDSLTTKMDSVSSSVEKLLTLLSGSPAVRKAAGSDKPFGEAEGELMKLGADSLERAGIFTRYYAGRVNQNMTQDKFDGLARFMGRESGGN